MTQAQSVIAGSLADRSIAESQPGPNIKAPHYLTAHYWWAYVHPRAVWFFERQWLVNLILWGNYVRLRDAAMADLGDVLPGATLQVACVYGDLTAGLTRRVAAGGGRLDVVNVLPMQLEISAASCRPARRRDCCRWIPPISGLLTPATIGRCCSFSCMSSPHRTAREP